MLIVDDFTLHADNDDFSLHTAADDDFTLHADDDDFTLFIRRLTT